MLVALHVQYLKSSHGHTSDEDMVRQDVLLGMLIAVDHLCLGGGSVEVHQRSRMAHFAKLLEQTSVSRRLNVLYDVIEHDKVKGHLSVGLGKCKIGGVTYIYIHAWEGRSGR